MTGRNACPPENALPRNPVTQTSYARPESERPTSPSEAANRPLVLCNLALCTEVLSYGRVKRFEKYEFFQDQEVLLYAEVENYASQPSGKGYHTSLGSTYEVFDSSGRLIVKRAFATIEDYCENPRHDFFTVYRLRVPKPLAPGRYLVRLSLEDLLAHKTGQATIMLMVKEGEEPRKKEEKKK